MLLLFESSAGFALFKVLDEGKLREAETKVGTELGRLPRPAAVNACMAVQHAAVWCTHSCGRPPPSSQQQAVDGSMPAASAMGCPTPAAGCRPAASPPRLLPAFPPPETHQHSWRPQDVWSDFETPEAAKKVVKLKAFSKFENTTEALQAAASLVDSKISKGETAQSGAASQHRIDSSVAHACGTGHSGLVVAVTSTAALVCSLPTPPCSRSRLLRAAGLKKFLKKHAEGDTLAVLDAKLGNVIKEKLGINCLYSSGVMELTRGIRNQLTNLVGGLSAQDLRPMSLGLSHSLSRYKLKFSPDKVDTMIVQVRREGSGSGCCRWGWGFGAGAGKQQSCRGGPCRRCRGGPRATAASAGRSPRRPAAGRRPTPPPPRSARPADPRPCRALPTHPAIRPLACWMIWTRSSTRMPCACASGTAGTSPR